ncbi:MAG: PBP1A family penicillin-binding protein [bacterium]|nr:PBP1A family penicillin-binding protein [bacterium]
MYVSYDWNRESLKKSKKRRSLRRRRRSKLSLPRLRWSQVLLIFLSLSLVGVLLGFLGISALFAYYAKDLPNPNKVQRREGYSTQIFDRNGVLLYSLYADENREPVRLDEVPLFLRQATIATEDQNFYKHPGFDLKGIVRAFVKTVFFGQVQGGSTLTQQLVKNVLLSSERTLPRKIKELILTVQIEKKYSKDEILQMYLNEAPYGGQAWGVKAAAYQYFGKEVKDLNLAESTILAGLPQSPTRYSQNFKLLKARQKHVLKRMVEDGYITKDQAKKAYDQEVGFKIRGNVLRAPHFVMYVRELLAKKYGEERVLKGGFRVTTTLDYKLQEFAEKAVKDEIEKVRRFNITNAGVVVVDPETGEVLAMVGSYDYFADDYDGQYNVTLALRQPGSAIKPVTYATAFRQGMYPSKMIVDAPTVFVSEGGKDYKPVNYDGKFHGPVSLRTALGSSLNIPAVKLLARVGIKEMLNTAADLGLATLAPTTKNLKRFGLSVTLGGGEVRLLDLAEAYSVFANGGYKVKPQAVLEIKDVNGQVVERFKPEKRQRVISAGVAFLINSILSDNTARLLTFGRRSAIYIAKHQVAVKTGTTNDKRDNWTIGWTPKVLVGVWVGNNDNSSMKRIASGVTGAAPIWRRIILEKLKDLPVQQFEKPDEVVEKEVDVISGYPAHDGFLSRKDYFIKGTEPIGKDPIHTRIKVCKGDPNKLAGEALVAAGEYVEKEAVILRESDPLSKDGKNRWQEGIDAWIASQTDERYKVPKEYCDDKVLINFDEYSDKQRIDQNDINLKFKVLTSRGIERVRLLVDGDQRKEWQEDKKRYEADLYLADGRRQIKIEVELKGGGRAENYLRLAVKRDWDEPTPTPKPTDTPTPTPTAVLTPTPTATVTPTP